MSLFIHILPMTWNFSAKIFDTLLKWGGVEGGREGEGKK